MKRTVYLTNLLLASVLLVLGSCETYDDLFPEEYHATLTLQTSGTVANALYTTGFDGEYEFTVMKGGSEPELSATGRVESMNAAEFAQYCETWNLSYTMIPPQYYSLENNDLSFAGADQRYAKVKTIFKTSELKTLFEASPNTRYALPLLLTSTEATVNDSLLLLVPNIMTPNVRFSRTEYLDGNLLASFAAGSEDRQTLEVPVVLPIDNQWDFTATAVAAPEAFDSYNASHGGIYTLLPEEYYTLADNGTITFTSDQTSARLSIDVTRPNDMKKYILPVRLTGCSFEDFDLDESIIYIGIYNGLVDLTVDMLSANSIETNYQDGTGLAGLIDGRGAGLHFHSSWSAPVGDPTYGNYIQVNLKRPMSTVQFEYYTRFENASSAPKVIEVFISQDGSSWESLSDEISEGLPNTGNARYLSPVFDAGHEFSYFRFCVLQGNGNCRTGGFFNLGEFGLWGL